MGKSIDPLPAMAGRMAREPERGLKSLANPLRFRMAEGKRSAGSSPPYRAAMGRWIGGAAGETEGLSGAEQLF